VWFPVDLKKRKKGWARLPLNQTDVQKYPTEPGPARRRRTEKVGESGKEFGGRILGSESKVTSSQDVSREGRNI